MFKPVSFVLTILCSFTAIAVPTVPAIAIPMSFSMAPSALKFSSLRDGDTPRLTNSNPDPSPELAMTLSIGIPMLAAGLTAATALGSDNNNVALSALSIGLPIAGLSFGSGQVYAGDPLRGLLVGLGSYPAMLAGVGVGYLSTQNSNIGSMMGGTLSSLAYLVWAGTDAADVARRHRASIQQQDQPSSN